MIEYQVGDATHPEMSGNKIIAHVCNNCSPGCWGAGFVVAVSRRWEEPENEYRAWSIGKLLANEISEDPISYRLGEMILVAVEKDIWVANMVAQEGVGWKAGDPPIRYDALGKCLATLGDLARNLNACVVMPRIGCGLAGGTWDQVEPLLNQHLSDLRVVVYDLPSL